MCLEHKAIFHFGRLFVENGLIKNVKTKHVGFI